MSASDRRRESRSGGGGRDRIAFEERESHRERNSHGSIREKLKMSERSRDRENEGGRDKERDWDREKERDSSRLGRKERGQDREKERNRDRRRDYERGRSTNDERGRDKFDEWDRFHNRDNDRRQKYDIEKEKRQKHRSRSRSKDRFSKRTKSRSPSPSKSKRTSGFDMAPLGVSDTAIAGSLPVVPQLVTGTLPTMLPVATHQIGSIALMPAQAVTQQATRHARRVYVGGLPPLANEQNVINENGKYMNLPATFMYTSSDEHINIKDYIKSILICTDEHRHLRLSFLLHNYVYYQNLIFLVYHACGNLYLVWPSKQTIATFFSHVMSAIGGNSAGDAVVNVYINHEKKFAFVEMRSVEEASNAMALDGIIFEGVPVKVRRPTDYNPSLAATLGPSQPSPHLNLAAVGLLPSAIGGSEGPDRVFVGGLPYYFTDAQIRELLESFGPLRGFDLVKDRDTGNSKGYGFCVYQDPSVTDIACAALNGLKMGEKTLTVRRATASMGQMKPEQELILQQAHEHIAIQKLALQSGGASHFPGFALNANTSAEPPTKVVCLTEVVSVDELRDEEVYKEILEDMREESEKFGSLINLVIPRPGPTGEAISGVGKVFLEYANVTDSARAKVSLHGRRFGENVVSATYYSEEKFATGDYDATVVA
ncbi:unnamed protein product [Musa hybrid cultivar]